MFLVACYRKEKTFDILVVLLHVAVELNWPQIVAITLATEDEATEDLIMMKSLRLNLYIVLGYITLCGLISFTEWIDGYILSHSGVTWLGVAVSL